MDKALKIAAFLDYATILGLKGLAIWYLYNMDMELFLLSCIANSVWCIDYNLLAIKEGKGNG